MPRSVTPMRIVRIAIVMAAVAAPLAPALADDAMSHAAMSLHDTLPNFARTPHGAALDAEAPFYTGNAAAMDKMMADMAVAPTGDVDKDFVNMMVPHHQGAIDMAKLYLRYGHNATLRHMAQGIIVTQQREIIAMRRAVGEPPPSTPAPTDDAISAMPMPSIK